MGLGKENYDKKLVASEKDTLINFRKEPTDNPYKRRTVIVHTDHPSDNEEKLGWIEGEKIKNFLSL